MRVRTPSQRCDRRSTHRGGSAYLLTLGTAMIVSLLGLAALSTVRIQRLHVDETSLATQAQLNATSALEIALFRVENDASWRTQLASSSWTTDQDLAQGTFRISATDPEDGDLADDPYDQVDLIVTGSSGGASHRIQVRLQTYRRGVRALEAAVHADDNFNFNQVTVTSDGIVSANGTVNGSLGATVTADLEAPTINANGAVVNGSMSTDGGWPRGMPSLASVFDYYLANGTAIDIDDLPVAAQNLLSNPDMESGTSGWTDNGNATLQSTTDEALSPSKSILVKSRGASSDGIRQNVLGSVEDDSQYYVEAWVYTDSGNTDEFRIVLRTVDTLLDLNLSQTGWVPSTAAGWTLVSGIVSVPQSLVLTQARLYVESRYDTKDFYIDDVLMRTYDDESNARVIEKQLVSPANNPFGSNTTNGQGIYVIDCQGERIIIRDSRIVGTLVLIDADSNSRVEGSVNWEPAVYGDNPATANLPALLTNSTFGIFCTSQSLSEASLGVNFNPTGTPYEGSADTDTNNSYPSLIRGVVFAGGPLDIDNAPTFDGAVLSLGDIDVTGTSVEFGYDPIYLEQNPPPGFVETPQPQVDSATFLRVVE